jgi:hypothetical protein
LYVVIAILNEKIEGFFNDLKDQEYVFKEIQLNYGDNKKMCELVDEILDMLNGDGKVHKNKRRSDMNIMEIVKFK